MIKLISGDVASRFYFHTYSDDELSDKIDVTSTLIWIKTLVKICRPKIYYIVEIALLYLLW